MFGEVVGAVRSAFAPVNLNLSLADAITNPIKTHVNSFRPFCLTVSVAMPPAVLLSVAIGVAGWG